MTGQSQINGFNGSGHDSRCNECRSSKTCKSHIPERENCVAIAIDPDEEERKFAADCLDLLIELKEKADTRAPVPQYERGNP